MSTVYIVILTYIKPLDEIDAAIPAHVEWLKKGYAEGIFLASGRRSPRNGGVILAKCESLASFEERLREDPFQKLKLATVEIIPFEPSMKTEFLENVF
ncbi:YciI family protein [Enterobacter ludwigii]